MNLPPDDPFNRRDVLRLAAAGACLGAGKALAQGGGESKPALPIALQLYSVRQECAKDKGKNLSKVVQAVARMGYQGVEFAGYYDHNAEDLRKMLDDNGLKCVGTHTALTTLQGDALAGTVAFHKTLGNKFLIVPSLPGQKQTVEAWKLTAGRFNDIAAKLKGEGMHCGYHNHSVEFQDIGGTTAWDVFFQNTVPEVVMQLDTGNCLAGKGDPVAFLKRYPGRTLTLHVKEHGGGPKAVVGEGDVAWKEVIRLARTTAGTQWFIIEHERGDLPPLEAVAKCLVNFKKLLDETA